MDFKTALDLARTWLEDCDRDHLEGYVVIFNGVVAGWKRELDNPQGWEPGCLAINHAGDIHQAVGGDAYNGAQAWLPIEKTMNTKAQTVVEKATENDCQFEPMIRTVSNYQRISFKGNQYDVRPLGLSKGSKITVAESESFIGEVCAFMEDTNDFYEVVLKKITFNELGFDVDAPVLGAKE